MRASRRAWSVVLALILLPGRTIAQAPPLVLILAGQSNMVGQGVTDELPPELSVLPPRVEFFVGARRTVLSETSQFGPEVTLAHELARAMPDRDIVMIKHALGGTSLLAWSPAWDSAQADVTQNAAAGPLYRQLLTFIEQVSLPRGAEF